MLTVIANIAAVFCVIEAVACLSADAIREMSDIGLVIRWVMLAVSMCIEHHARVCCNLPRHVLTSGAAGI